MTVKDLQPIASPSRQPYCQAGFGNEGRQATIGQKTILGGTPFTLLKIYSPRYGSLIFFA
jgi:hypothetical protein